MERIHFTILYGCHSYIFVGTIPKKLSACTIKTKASFSADIISTGDDTLKFYALNNSIVASDLCHTQRNVKRNGFTITLIIYC